MYALRKFVACNLIKHDNSTSNVKRVGELLEAYGSDYDWTTMDINCAFRFLERYQKNIKAKYNCAICQCEVVEI